MLGLRGLLLFGRLARALTKNVIFLFPKSNPNATAPAAAGSNRLLRRVRVTRRAVAFLHLCPPQRRSTSRLSHLPPTVARSCPASPNTMAPAAAGSNRLLRRVRVTRRAAAFLHLYPPQRCSASRPSHLPSTVPCPAMTRPRASRRWCRGFRLWPHRSAPRALSAPPMWRSSQPSRAPPSAASEKGG